MAQITGVKIKNFMSIDSQIVFDELTQQNILTGLYGAVKKTFAKAIFFGLGASSEQLSVTQYSDLKNSGSNPTSVHLTLKYNDRNYTVERTLEPLGSIHEQSFLLNDRHADENEYYDTLKELTFDLDKQMLLCDSANVMLLQNMIAAQPLSLLGTITGSRTQTNAAIKHSHVITQLTEKLPVLGKIYRRLKHSADTLENALPEQQQSHADQFTAYTISKLKREQAERTAREAELEVVENELHSRGIDIQTFRATIAEQTELRDRKLNDNQSMLAQLTDAADGESCSLVLGIRKMMCKRSLEQVHQRIGDALKLIAALERLKGEAESNIAFMNGASGTKQKSKMVTRENVLKLYPIIHHKDELEMDQTQLKLLQKHAELEAAKNKNEIFDLMDQLLPLRQRKPMADPKPIQDIFSDIQSAIKDVLHPMAYMPPNDALKMEKLRSLIPSTEGFLLYGTFRANDAQHQKLIDNILSDYMYTIALFKDDRLSVYKMLQRNYPQWCSNVKYLVLSELPSPSSRTGYVPPPDHWLTYCTFTHTNIDDKSRLKLMYYLGKHLEIRCVETHDSVKEEFQRRTKKYVASLDGQLIYGQCSFGFDVLTCTIPGNTTMKDMRLPAACQRLEDAMRKLNEFTSTFIETENVPRNRPVSNIVALEGDLLVHEQEFAQQQQQKNDRIETLLQLMNAPYEAPDVQDYTDALVAKRHRLDDINRRITAARNEIAQCTAETARLTQKIDELTKCIDLKEKLTVNEQDIVRHNATIKASEQKIENIQTYSARLQLKYDDLMRAVTSLKYETIKTVLRAQQANIDWSSIDCTTQPANLLQDIRNGIYVTPLPMSFTFNDMTDTFDPDVFYANSHWYAVRDQCKEKADEINEMIQSLSAKLNDSKRRLNSLREMIVNKFTDCIRRINFALNEMVDTIHSRDDNVAYELSSKFDDIFSDRSAIFKMIIDGDAVDVKSLSKFNQIRSSWLLFAAINEYSKAPFAFIDLEQMDEDSVAIIDPIIRRMADKIQLFIDSSSPNHSHFAKVHYGLGTNENAANFDERVMVVRHDASQFVANDGRGGRGARDSYVDGSGDVNQRDENVDQRDGNVDDGNVDQRDGNVDQRDGNVDDGNVDQRDGNVDDGNVDQRDGNVDDGNVDDGNVDDGNVDDGNVYEHS